jgi:hypothetical protein
VHTERSGKTPFDGRTDISQSCSDETILVKCLRWPLITPVAYLEPRLGGFIIKLEPRPVGFMINVEPRLGEFMINMYTGPLISRPLPAR